MFDRLILDAKTSKKVNASAQNNFVFKQRQKSGWKVWIEDSGFLGKPNTTFLLLSAFLRNFFLRQDRLSGDVPPHLAQPCYVAIGQALIWGFSFSKPNSACFPAHWGIFTIVVQWIFWLQISSAHCGPACWQRQAWGHLHPSTSTNLLGTSTPPCPPPQHLTSTHFSQALSFWKIVPGQN